LASGQPLLALQDGISEKVAGRLQQVRLEHEIMGKLQSSQLTA